MKIILLALLFISECFALEAVVTVLETPMLKEKSLDAPVVQYLRKGDVIKVDPSLANTEDYEFLAPAPEKLKALREKYSASPEWKEDQVFKGTTPAGKDADEFVAVLDRQGKTVYVIREHLYIFYESKKELTQRVTYADPTDYRLEEPLPKKYPLISPSGYRGQVVMGFTQPYYESYPYDSNLKNKSYASPFDFNLSMLRRKPTDTDDRFYAGGTFNLRYFSNDYSLVNGRQTTETGLKLGVGPYLAYDAYKGEKNRINLFFSLNLYLYNQIYIHQKDRTGQYDDRNYKTYSATPRIGAQYHRKAIFEEIDFVLGTSFEIDPPTTYQADSASKQPTWWRGGGSDKFKTRATFTLAGFIGFQSAY